MRISNRVLISALLAVAAVPAGAVTWTASPGAPDPGPSAGQTLIADFETPATQPGYTLSGNFNIVSGTTAAAAAPAGDASHYLYTSPAIPTGVATLSTLDLINISFYWGSIDDYNKVEVLGDGGSVIKTISGLDVSPATGDQSNSIDNKRIFIKAGAGQKITGLRFTATGISFEVDNVYGTLLTDDNGSTVPEPATWALMIGGFGMVGVGARRRRKAALRVTA
ncbi:PEPxxWA-CTERM sorting domain-containing protein [Sphingosinicellaceae bacterium]|nr:PEPxxWA-CTERM sorting domain-containing protein [Sphingosinicellaceae bacterium]